MRRLPCWCFKCNRNVMSTPDFRCPYCLDDFLEVIEEDQHRERRYNEIRPNVQRNEDQHREPRYGRFIPLYYTSENQDNNTRRNEYQSRNNEYQYRRNEDQRRNNEYQSRNNEDQRRNNESQRRRNEERGGDFYQELFGRMFDWVGNIVQRNSSEPRRRTIDINDFFTGSEDQLQELIERLMGMNEGSSGSRPAQQRFINRLRTEKFRDSRCSDDSCPICLDQFQPSTDIVVLPCNHGFHKNCIEPWLKMHSECPLCRHKLPEDDE